MDAPVGHRQEVIFGSTVDVDDVPAVHSIRIHVDGIYGVGDKDCIVLAEKVCDVAGV